MNSFTNQCLWLHRHSQRSHGSSHTSTLSKQQNMRCSVCNRVLVLVVRTQLLSLLFNPNEQLISLPLVMTNKTNKIIFNNWFGLTFSRQVHGVRSRESGNQHISSSSFGRQNNNNNNETINISLFPHHSQLNSGKRRGDGGNETAHVQVLVGSGLSLSVKSLTEL